MFKLNNVGVVKDKKKKQNKKIKGEKQVKKKSQRDNLDDR